MGCLLLAMIFEGRGDLAGAVREARRALYLEPDLAMGHAFRVALFKQLGMQADAELARRNALRALEGCDDSDFIPAVEPMTAGALRRVLGATGQNRPFGRGIARSLATTVDP
jgi:chemotaxis protein methyltransferase CheR